MHISINPIEPICPRQTVIEQTKTIKREDHREGEGDRWNRLYKFVHKLMSKSLEIKNGKSTWSRKWLK